jgi:cell division initiation protein
MEIRNQQFGKSIRGYNEDEVKIFLQQIAQDYENLYGENSQLKESIQRCKFELEKYHKIEEAMNNSLILAQQTAENLKAGAEKEAERRLDDAKRAIVEMLDVYQELMKSLNMFNMEFKSRLNLQLEILDKNIAKNEEVSIFFNKPDIKDLMANLSRMTVNVKPDAANS